MKYLHGLALLLVLAVPGAPVVRAEEKAAASSSSDEKLYTTGLVVVEKEGDRNELGILVPEWEVLVSVQAFGIDPEKVLTEDNYQVIQLVEDDAAKGLFALAGKIVALEGKLEQGDGEQRFKVSRFVEVKDETSARGLGAIAELSRKAATKK